MTAVRRLAGAATRHPVLTVFLVALLARVAVAVGTTLIAGGSLFSDDSTYVRLAEQKASGDTGQWDDYTYALYETTATFSVPLTLLFRVVGPSPLAGMLLVGLFGSFAAALTTRLALEVMTRPWALLAGGVVALLPSQVLFSSLVLKDAAVWAVLAALGVLSALTGRSTGWRIPALVGGSAAMLFLLGNLRVHTLVAAAWALGLASLFGRRRQWGRRVALTTVSFVAVPWLFSLGPAGLGLVLDAQGTLEERRANNAAGAATAFVERPAEPVPAPTPPPITAPPPPAEDDAALGTNVRHLPRGLVVMLLEPLPWQVDGNVRVQLALAENLLWWPLLALALLGSTLLRRFGRALAFPFLVGGAVAVLYALSEGNFGTAYRHRGELVWAVAVLAAAGAAWIAERRGRRAFAEPAAEGSADAGADGPSDVEDPVADGPLRDLQPSAGRSQLGL